MKRKMHVPIRLRFQLTSLALVSLVVGLITFSTASLFQEDKQGYVNGLTSMIVQGTAEDAQGILEGYREKLQLYGRLLLESDAHAASSETLSRTVFDEFPELIGVSVLRQGRNPLAVHNVTRLTEAGVKPEDLARSERDHPLPADSIDTGVLFLRAASISKTLPAFLLAFRLPMGGAGTRAPVVSAIVSTERLQALMSRFTAYTVYLLDADKNILAHSDANKLGRPEALRDRSYGGGQDTGHAAGMTREYVRDGTAMIGGYAPLHFAGALAGAEIPRSAAHLASKRLMGRLILVAGILLVLAVVVGIISAHRITRPVERLSQATRLIGKGDFDVHVEVTTSDEIGALGQSFNQMADRLRQREEELNATHAQLVQSEKLAAFGQLGAGIAHEVKNPLAGILGCVELMLEEVSAESQIETDLRLVEKETKRCKTIIDNLMRFARQEESVKSPTDINQVVADAIAIVRHQLEIHRVRLEHELDPHLPPVNANANQLEQVFINFMVNAQQAMETTGGRMRITSCLGSSGSVELRFTDTGPGIREEHRKRLFEPFFTTKAVGKGTGLGLSVSYGIIKDHRGEITVESEIGKGTTFVVQLPVLDPIATGDGFALRSAGAAPTPTDHSPPPSRSTA
jgi:signal transduction histidine kinase